MDKLLCLHEIQLIKRVLEKRNKAYQRIRTPGGNFYHLHQDGVVNHPYVKPPEREFIIEPYVKEDQFTQWRT